MINKVVIHGEVFPFRSFSSISHPVIAPAKIEPITAIPIVKLSPRTVSKNFKLLSFLLFNLTYFRDGFKINQEELAVNLTNNWGFFSLFKN